MGMYALGVVVAPVIGPTLGGYLTDHVSWRWAFYINIPIGLVAVLLQSKFLEDPPFIKKAKPGRLDGTGLAFLALWLGALQVVCDKGQEDDWFGSSLIRWMAVTCIVGFVAWIVRERVAKSPLVNLRIFLNRNFAVGCLLIGLFGACIYGVTTILPLFFQTLLGYDATSAGLAVAPRGIGAMVGAIVVGIIVSRVDSRKLIAHGLCRLRCYRLLDEHHDSSDQFLEFVLADTYQWHSTWAYFCAAYPELHWVHSLRSS